MASLGSGRAVEAQDLPPALRGQILLRALAYDYKLRARCGNAVTLALLARASGPSRAERDAIAKTIDPALRIAGLPLRLVSVSYTSAAALAPALRRAGACVAYVAGGLEAELAAIKQTLRQGRISSLCGSRAAVEQGLALGAVVAGGRPRLLVNLEALRAEGMEVDARVLKLAEVIR